MVKVRFLAGFTLLALLITTGVFVSAQNFNREMGQPTAVVFKWQKIETQENCKSIFKGVILGREFYVPKESFEEFRNNVIRSYSYWKEKVF